jgi:hypothetical protein
MAQNKGQKQTFVERIINFLLEKNLGVSLFAEQLLPLSQ